MMEQFYIQDAGYYCAWCFTEKLAKIELTNLNYSLREINGEMFKKNYTTSLYGMLDLISHTKINLKNRIKLLLRKVLPKFMWKTLKKFYHKMRGIK